MTAGRALVTGAAGFIGSHLARRLDERGYHVIAVDNLTGGWRDNLPDDMMFFDLELTDRQAVEDLWWSIRPDMVFHFAAYAAPGLSHWVRRFNYDNNLAASVNLINCAIQDSRFERFVFASSMSIYGDGDPPYDETTPARPVDPYAVAKWATEQDLRIAGDTHGLDWTIIRPHNVYGPNQNLGDPYRNVVGIFMRQAMAGQPLTIYGDGLQTRAYSYISDIIDPIIDSTYLPPDVFNIGGDQPYTILDVATAVEAEFGAVKVVHLPERLAEVKHQYCDHSKAKLNLGFQPKIELTEGVARMAEWARTAGVRWSQVPSLEIDVGLPDYWKSD